MTSALLILNAAAIAVLVAFHFQPADNAAPTESSTAHYSQRQTPQLAVMNSQVQPGKVNQVTQGSTPSQPAPLPTESWVF
ncbi:hypothetical protein [Pseudomonas sp. PH1b]|uniref:hypothetical protein n=1 Tax=Pseudomonas sp. PH1b TaxID=1397282 RepID=UPI0004680772|nr:hypothetical protein [Pseudomonas sp. PH1b]